MSACRGCGAAEPNPVLDLGAMPAADNFPLENAPITATESGHRLVMTLCRYCGLAQLADDDTVPQEQWGVEPSALRDQAAAALRAVSDAGWLTGGTVTEFGSPHGGSWLPLLADHGYTVTSGHWASSLVLDCFGIMHAADQREAFRNRARALADDGVLLLQFHSLAAILMQRQWTALRHGHFAYYSLGALNVLLLEVGLHLADAWTFDLYGGTVLVAATRTPRRPLPPAVRAIFEYETTVGVADPDEVRALQRASDEQAAALRQVLVSMHRERRCVYAYGAASRAVPLFSRARLDRRLVTAVADASPAKQGRRMPGTDIPIVSPERMLHARPDRVLLTLPDLLPELRSCHPDLEGRWFSPSDPAAPRRHDTDGSAVRIPADSNITARS